VEIKAEFRERKFLATRRDGDMYVLPIRQTAQLARSSQRVVDHTHRGWKSLVMKMDDPVCLGYF
jgi:hypothetical protein